MSYSDNAATNILITRLGGTKSINEFAKSIGDTSFNLENLEPNIKKLEYLTYLNYDYNLLLLIYFGGDIQKLTT